MILRFLRMFAQFRASEAQIQKLRREVGRSIKERERLQAELSVLRVQHADATAEVKRLNEQLVAEAHKVADVMSMQAIGKRMYSKAEVPPASASQPNVPIAQGRTFARAQQTAIINQTQADLMKIFDELPA